ncbi:hypothetical protein [Kouleothrix sp.]|uniref:hypothetical protein n=1 Tax=Kouleothrix sp. TaxID=2779161 RepID=UPI00391DB123
MNLENAIDLIILKRQRDATRLAPLADYAKEKLQEYGLPGVRGGTGGELLIAGLARKKAWDVAYNFSGKDRLIISLKSIWANPGGTVPNRIDDLMGETANVQQMSPEIVTGYILLFDSQVDTIRREDGLYWSAFFEKAIKRIAIRKAPLWNQGLLEGALFIKFDSKQSFGKRILEPEKVSHEEDAFFLSLLKELKLREPAIPFSKTIL